MTTPNLLFENSSWCFPNRSFITPSFPQSFNKTQSACPAGSCRCPFQIEVIQNFSNVIQYLAIGITSFNMVAHLISAVVFLELMRGRDLAQQNHHLLFILSIFEMINAFFIDLKPAIGNTEANFQRVPSFKSLSDLKMRYYLTMLVHCLTSTSLFCRNWWLVVIALTRSVTVVRLQRILKNADGFQPVTNTLRRINITAVCVALAGMAVALLVHGFIVPIRLTFFLCRSKHMSDMTPEQMANVVDAGITIRRVKVMTFAPHQLFRVLVDFLHELLVLVLPIFIMSAATVVIWISLRRLSRGPCMVPNQRVQMMSRVTRLIAILLTIFVVLEPLAPICFLVRQLMPRTERCWMLAMNYIILPIADLFIALDSTTNLVVYYLWDKAFHHHVKRALQRYCHCKNELGQPRRQVRRDTFPTTNQALTAGVTTALTTANPTNVGLPSQGNGTQCNIELCPTKELLLKEDDCEETQEMEHDV